MPTYRVPAHLPQVVDGDTIKFLLDIGWHVHLAETIRLYGINCPETRGKRASAAGITAANFTRDWVGQAKTLEVESLSFDSRKEKFGRTLARIYRTLPDGTDDPVSLNDALLEAGHAVPYEL